MQSTFSCTETDVTHLSQTCWTFYVLAAASLTLMIFLTEDWACEVVWHVSTLLSETCFLRKCNKTAYVYEPIAHAHVGWSHLMAIKHFNGSLSCYVIISTILLNHMWTRNDLLSCKKQWNWISWETLNTNFQFQCLPWWRWMYLRFIWSKTLLATEMN